MSNDIDIAALRHRVGQQRWRIVSKTTGKPVGLRISYPNQRLAEANCGSDEIPEEVRVAGAAGPFSDHVERAQP